MASTDTFNFTSVPGFGEGSRRPVAIDYDPVDGMVYWTDVQHGSISRSLLDGSSYVVLLTGLQSKSGFLNFSPFLSSAACHNDFD